MMKVFDIETCSSYSQNYAVVADSYAEAERIFLAKYWPITIKGIRLHSEYAQVQEVDEQPKITPNT